MGDDAAAYARPTTRSTSPSSSPRTSNGALDRNLPGSAHGYGGTAGDFAVAYIVAHEYGHQIQHELGGLRRAAGSPLWPSNSRPTATRATGPESASTTSESRTATSRKPSTPLSPSETFDTSNPGHHGTPEQRREAAPGPPASRAAIPRPAASTWTHEARYRIRLDLPDVAQLVEHFTRNEGVAVGVSRRRLQALWRGIWSYTSWEGPAAKRCPRTSWTLRRPCGSLRPHDLAPIHHRPPPAYDEARSPSPQQSRRSHRSPLPRTPTGPTSATPDGRPARRTSSAARRTRAAGTGRCTRRRSWA